jgi:hypothetical protein
LGSKKGDDNKKREIRKKEGILGKRSKLDKSEKKRNS